MTAIRTRFAPSPTGHVHIGNIRVAIYNWLYARRHGGQFLLRVEDTDRERSTAEAVDAVHRAMDWLGLDVDETPLFQSTQKDAHLAAAEQLLKDGKAYMEDKGGTGQGECVVFRMSDQERRFVDGVKGELKKSGEHMQDFVIVRSDGSPVFHLANVVDDIHMGVTDIIRGDDHVENTFRHLALFEALGAPAPRYAHLPMIVNAQGKPYSKRDGDAFVGDFRDHGYQAEALFNYLVLLGWSSGDDQEIFSRQELVARFDLDRVQSSAAQFDLRKLQAINAAHLQKLPVEEFSALATAELERVGMDLSGIDADARQSAFALLQPRVKVLPEVAGLGAMLFTENFPVDDKAMDKRIRKPEAAAVLDQLRALLEGRDSLTPSDADGILHQLINQLSLGPGQVNPVVRVALTGQMGGPELIDLMAWLGPARIRSRVGRIQVLASEPSS